MDTMSLTAKYEDEMITIRRHIHRHPELSNKEYKTTEFIREKLTEYGVEIAEIGMKTGVVAVIRGGKPGKTVVIREDIDALPMKELTGLPFASENDGACHSCGHDIHTTVLLYCAKVLSEIREELAGTVMLIFQPAEEHMGAGELVDCNFTQVAKPDAFIGLHVSPEIDAGSIGLKKGPANASNDFFNIKIKGKGGHGAHPENCIDPVVISGYVITQLQTVISRENYPVYPGVLTIGSIHGGTVNNIIPDYVEMHGTLRSLDPDCRKKMMAAIDRVVKGCAESMRGTAEVEWEIGVPPLVNDDSIIEARNFPGQFFTTFRYHCIPRHRICNGPIQFTGTEKASGLHYAGAAIQPTGGDSHGHISERNLKESHRKITKNKSRTFTRLPLLRTGTI